MTFDLFQGFHHKQAVFRKKLNHSQPCHDNSRHRIVAFFVQPKQHIYLRQLGLSAVLPICDYTGISARGPS